MSTLIMREDITDEIYYPESDGQPMGETDLHRDAMIALIEALKDHYRDDPNVYFSGDLFVYYEKGKPAAVFSPDAFVVFGVAKRERRTYKVWEEGGKAPDVVFEVTSESTVREDKGSKKEISQWLGVSEYFLYDPEAMYLRPSLQGFRLVHGRYQSITPAANGLYSEQLNLYLQLDGTQLRLIDAQTGEPLLTPAEAQAARRQAETELAHLRAEIERLRSQ
jgi:Uma2 family endonuclease